MSTQPAASIVTGKVHLAEPTPALLVHMRRSRLGRAFAAVLSGEKVKVEATRVVGVK